MFTQAITAQAEFTQAHGQSIPTEDGVRVPPEPISLPVYPVMLVAAILTLCIILVIALAQTHKASAIVEPPQGFLPGSVLPAEAFCKASPDGHCYPPLDTHCNVPGDGRCFTYPEYDVETIGKKVYLTVEVESGMIRAALIPATEYTVWNLISAWGSPTGFSQNGTTLRMDWNTRSVYLDVCPFRPEDRVKWITYHSDLVEAPPWRGFKQVDFAAKCGNSPWQVDIGALLRSGLTHSSRS